MTGELVDFSGRFFFYFFLFLFFQGSLRPRLKEERAGLGFFFFPLSRRIAETAFPTQCVTLGVVSGAVEAAATTEPA